MTTIKYSTQAIIYIECLFMGSGCQEKAQNTINMLLKLQKTNSHTEHSGDLENFQVHGPVRVDQRTAEILQ